VVFDHKKKTKKHKDGREKEKPVPQSQIPQRQCTTGAQGRPKI
jgi:hypothetical protein